MNRLFLVSVLLPLLFVTTQAQAPLAVNTSLLSFTPVTSSNWIAEAWGYTDAAGNEYALICRGNSGFNLYNVNNGAFPVLMASISATASDLKDIGLWQNYAYCVQQGGDILIVDLSNPAAANVVSTIPNSGGHNAYCADGYLYYSRSGASGSPLEIWDLANPTNPVFRSSFDPGGHNSHDAHVLDNLCFDFDIGNGYTRVLDVTNKSNPVELGATGIGNHAGWGYYSPGDGATILLTCDETAGGFLNSWDVSNPSNPIHLDSYVTDPAKSIHNIVVRGRYAYISYYVDGLRIVDLANPSNLKEVGVYDVRPSNAGTGLYDGSWGVYPITENKVILTEMFTNSPQGAAGFYVIQFNPPDHVDLQLHTAGFGDATMLVDGAAPFGLVYTAVSAVTSNPLGSGPFLGLEPDAFLTVLTAATPFQSLANLQGSVAFGAPAGTVPPGTSVDARSITLKSGAFLLSQINRIEF